MARLSATALAATMAVVGAILLAAGMVATAHARPFTYQGELTENGQPAAGDFDFRFQIYTSANGDILLTTTYTDDQVLVDGRFSAEIEAEELMTGFDRWIAVAVRPGSISNGDRSDATYSLLSPRQLITAAPYALTAYQANGLHLPIEEQLNLLSGPALKITNTVNTAIEAYSSTGVGLRADAPSGMAIYASSANGWAGNFQGAVYVLQRLALGYNQVTSLKLACNGDAAKPGGGSWSVLSDQRLKENIRPLTGALDRLMRLRGRTFDYTAEARERGLTLPGEQIGFVAQEVEEVFPEWIGEDQDGMKYVTERGTTALFVEALRELRAETEALRREVAELKAQRAGLDARGDADRAAR